MRVVLTAAAACAVLVACGSASAGPSDGTSLRIAFWEDATGASPDVVWTVRCDPASGSLARPARACARLEAGGAKLFAPLPKNIVCTEIYGGPQRARVVGTVAGRTRLVDVQQDERLQHRPLAAALAVAPAAGRRDVAPG